METKKASSSVPVLTEIWKEFATYDANAGRNQALFKRLQNVILALGVMAVLLAVIQTQRFGVDPDPSLWYQVLRWGIIIAPILIAALIALSNQFKAGNKWIMLRSGAESLKREIYRYRAQAGIYSDAATTEQSREEKLADKLTKIRRQVMKTSVSEGSLRPYDGPIPPTMYGAAAEDDGFRFISSEDYIKIRLGDQRDYYAGKTDALEKKLRFLQLLTIVIGGLGTLLAAVGFELWVAVTTALAAAFTTYLEYAQTEKTLVIYNQVATDLKNILTWWAALSPSEQAKASNHNLLVQQTEQALEAENSGWVQNMTEALAELQEQQAAMKDQVKAEVAAVYEQGAARQAALEEQQKAEGRPEAKLLSGPIAASLASLAPSAPQAEAKTAAAAAEPDAAAAPAPGVLNLTEQQMAEILKGNKEVSAWFKAAQKILPKYEINTPLRIAGFFAQCMHESLNFTVMEENLYYSASALDRVFGKYFKRAGRDATEYAKKPEKIANVVYASRMGNGNTQSGDGYRFRGRGIIQLTGRSNYTAFGKTINKSAEEVIDYVQTKEGALESACWYWNSRKINAAADAGDIVRMTKLVNGGTHGLADREKKFKHACAVLGITEEALPTPTSRTTILKKGSRGAAVKALQKALGLTADGSFGPGTEAALKKWQAANGLTADGIAGPATQEKLLGKK